MLLVKLYFESYLYHKNIDGVTRSLFFSTASHLIWQIDPKNSDFETSWLVCLGRSYDDSKSIRNDYSSDDRLGRLQVRQAQQEGIFPTVSGIAIILYTSQDSKADLFLLFNIDQAELFQL